jgi:hypothetical protein
MENPRSVSRFIGILLVAIAVAVIAAVVIRRNSPSGGS